MLTVVPLGTFRPPAPAPRRPDPQRRSTLRSVPRRRLLRVSLVTVAAVVVVALVAVMVTAVIVVRRPLPEVSGEKELTGLDADVTVTRLSETAFLVVTVAASQVRDMAWLARHLPPGAHVLAHDVTSGLPMLALMGPASRALLRSMTGADLSHEAFPFGASREVELGHARVRLSRVTFVGELGFVAPDHCRTQTLECVEPGAVLTITYDDLRQLYHQNPEFGFYFLSLTSARLMQNLAAAERELAALRSRDAQAKAVGMAWAA